VSVLPISMDMEILEEALMDGRADVKLGGGEGGTWYTVVA
jgi:hypothetical protein